MVECGGTVMNDRLSACRALYIWEGRAMYIGDVLDNTPHSHHALQVVVSTGKPFTISLCLRAQEAKEVFMGEFKRKIRVKQNVRA
jgi:hypothetical protein